MVLTGRRLPKSGPLHTLRIDLRDQKTRRSNYKLTFSHKYRRPGLVERADSEATMRRELWVVFPYATPPQEGEQQQQHHCDDGGDDKALHAFEY